MSGFVVFVVFLVKVLCTQDLLALEDPGQGLQSLGFSLGF